MVPQVLQVHAVEAARHSHNISPRSDSASGQLVHRWRDPETAPLPCQSLGRRRAVVCAGTSEQNMRVCPLHRTTAWVGPCAQHPCRTSWTIVRRQVMHREVQRGCAVS